MSIQTNTPKIPILNCYASADTSRLATFSTRHSTAFLPMRWTCGKPPFLTLATAIVVYGESTPNHAPWTKLTCFLFCRNYNQAIRYYSMAKSLVPHNSTIDSALGLSYHLIGDLDKAVDHYHRVSALQLLVISFSAQTLTHRHLFRPCQFSLEIR